MDGYRHYIRIDANNIIIDRYADWQEDRRQPDEICVNEDGGRHFNAPVTNERGQYISRWNGTQEVPRTDEELDSEWAALPPPPPSEAEQIATLKAKLAATEQSAADNSLTTQQLIETLIDLEVI